MASSEMKKLIVASLPDLDDGMMIIVQGVLVKDVDQKIILDLCHCSSAEFALRICLSFGLNIIFSIQVGGDTDYRSKSILRRLESDRFEIILLTTEEHFKISVNGCHICEVPHQLPVCEIDRLEISGDARVQRIFSQRPCSSDKLIGRSLDALQNGHRLISSITDEDEANTGVNKYLSHPELGQRVSEMSLDDLQNNCSMESETFAKKQTVNDSDLNFSNTRSASSDTEIDIAGPSNTLNDLTSVCPFDSKLLDNNVNKPSTCDELYNVNDHTFDGTVHTSENPTTDDGSDTVCTSVENASLEISTISENVGVPCGDAVVQKTYHSNPVNDHLYPVLHEDATNNLIPRESTEKSVPINTVSSHSNKESSNIPMTSVFPGVSASHGGYTSNQTAVPFGSHYVPYPYSVGPVNHSSPRQLPGQWPYDPIHNPSYGGPNQMPMTQSYWGGHYPGMPYPQQQLNPMTSSSAPQPAFNPHYNPYPDSGNQQVGTASGINVNWTYSNRMVIPNGMRPFQSIYIHGCLFKKRSWLTIELKNQETANAKIFLRVSIDLSNRKISRCSNIYDRWTDLENTISQFPFKVGIPFIITITCEPNMFRALAGDTHLFDFYQQTSPAEVRLVEISSCKVSSLAIAVN